MVAIRSKGCKFALIRVSKCRFSRVPRLVLADRSAVGVGGSDLVI